MKRTLALALVGCFLFVILSAAGCRAIPTVKQTFYFAREEGPAAKVTRNVSINAPPQNVGGNIKDVVVTAAPLPAGQPPAPPEGKGINKLVQIVMEPRVVVKDTDEILTTFDPPLTITIDFTAEDANAVPRDPTGKPQLSIITFYQDSAGWHWQRLATTVTCGKTCDEGTLKADVKTLQPNDPIAEGFP